MHLSGFWAAVDGNAYYLNLYTNIMIYRFTLDVYSLCDSGNATRPASGRPRSSILVPRASRRAMGSLDVLREYI